MVQARLGLLYTTPTVGFLAQNQADWHLRAITRGGHHGANKYSRQRYYGFWFSRRMGFSPI